MDAPLCLMHLNQLGLVIIIFDLGMLFEYLSLIPTYSIRLEAIHSSRQGMAWLILRNADFKGPLLPAAVTSKKSETHQVCIHVLLT